MVTMAASKDASAKTSMHRPMSSDSSDCTGVSRCGGDGRCAPLDCMTAMDCPEQWLCKEALYRPKPHLRNQRRLPRRAALRSGHGPLQAAVCPAVETASAVVVVSMAALTHATAMMTARKGLAAKPVFAAVHVIQVNAGRTTVSRLSYAAWAAAQTRLGMNAMMRRHARQSARRRYLQRGRHLR